MKFLVFLYFLFSIGCSSTPNFHEIEVKKSGMLLKVNAAPKWGFNFPFLLYIPENSNFNDRNLLVLTNNSGTHNDYDVTLKNTQDQILKWTDLSKKTSSPLMVPVFPRTKVDWRQYTHAFDRDTLKIDQGETVRIDLQLIEMSKTAQKVVLEKTGDTLHKKINLFGFSASAMFANRFTFIHPRFVSTVVFGSPGGWPLVPIKKFKNKNLRYPIGTSDLKELAGNEIDLKSLREVKIFAFMGRLDDNDSVVYRDSYDLEDQNLIFSLFGKTPIERWPIAERLYREAGLQSKFKVYDGIGHGTNRVMNNEVANFFISNFER